MKINNYKSKAWKYGNKTKVSISFEIEDNDERWNDIKFINRKLGYNEWMMEHIVNFCAWDYSFNINLLADSIEQTGRNIVTNGHFVGNEKTGRRALYAAHLLRNSYQDDNVVDHSYENNMKRGTFKWKSLKNGMSQMVNIYPYDNAMGMDREEYELKMFKIILNRISKREKNKWDFAFDYLKKYLNRFWN